MNYLDSDNPNIEKVTVPLNIEQASYLIIQKAKQLVNQLIENRGHDKPPFLPAEFSPLQGIKKIIKVDLGKTSALLLRFQDGYVIKVNQKQNLARQNFSCAHEVGHILFNELKLEQYIRNIEYRTFNPQGEQKARAAARERLCDAVASELLMPEHVFGKYLLGFGVSIHSIERLSNTFRVSIQSAAIRIAEVSPEPCLALLWQPWPRNKPKGLRLAWCVGSGRSAMPVHKLVRYPSKLFEAYQYDNPVKSSKFFKINKSTKRLPMEYKGFGFGEKRFVISLAFLNR